MNLLQLVDLSLGILKDKSLIRWLIVCIKKKLFRERGKPHILPYYLFSLYTFYFHSYSFYNILTSTLSLDLCEFCSSGHISEWFFFSVRKGKYEYPGKEFQESHLNVLEKTKFSLFVYTIYDRFLHMHAEIPKPRQMLLWKCFSWYCIKKT